SMSSTVGGSDTMFSDSGTAARTWEYDMPPSIAANSSPQRNSHDAASASRAKVSGSAIGPRLKVRSAGTSKSAIGVRYSTSKHAVFGASPLRGAGKTEHPPN